MRGSVAKTHKLLSKHGACSLKVNGSCVFLPMSWAAFWREPILGITNPEFSGLARSLGRESNASRNLYRYILRKNKALPIPITFVQTPVRCCAPGALTKRKKKNVKVKIIPWPCMLLTDWVKVCMEDPKYRGRFFLGGHTLDTLEQAEDMLETFWHRYAKVETALSPTHPRRTIPVFLHGDEGRGLVHRPCLVLAYQPVLGVVGEATPNSHGNLGSESSVLFEFELRVR